MEPAGLVALMPVDKVAVTIVKALVRAPAVPGVLATVQTHVQQVVLVIAVRIVPAVAAIVAGQIVLLNVLLGAEMNVQHLVVATVQQLVQTLVLNPAHISAQEQQKRLLDFVL